MDSDRIEKRIVIRAPRAKVWRALTDARQFETWFGIKVEGEFSPGVKLWAVSLHPGYEGRFEFHIQQMEAERLFSWNWHPGKPGIDYSAERATLVVFELADTPEGTLLTVV